VSSGFTFLECVLFLIQLSKKELQLKEALERQKTHQLAVQDLTKRLDAVRQALEAIDPTGLSSWELTKKIHEYDVGLLLTGF
jgi:hypothetical protein